MAPKSKLSPKAEKALDRLGSVETALLTVQAQVGKHVREVQEVKAMFEDPQQEEKT